MSIRNNRKPTSSIRKPYDNYTQLTKINDATVLYNGGVSAYEDAADYYRVSIKAVKVG